MARDPNDITAYRKSKRARDNFLRLVILGIIISAIFLILTSGEDVFAPFQKLGTRLESEGFPITLSGSASYSMNRFGANFLLLSDTYLYTYTDNGGKIFDVRHNYERPFQKATDRRILLYNLNGYEFSLFNRNGMVYEEKLDDKIVLAELGNNDMAAIVTNSAAFSNILYVFDSNGRWRYRKRFIEEEVNAVTFAGRNNELFVATSVVVNGEIFSRVYRLRTDTDDDYLIWEQTLPADSWALNLRENGDRLTVLADNAMFTLDADSGEIIGRYEFNAGRLVQPVFGESFNLVILSDYVTRRTLYVTLDADSRLISTEIMPFEVKKVEIFGEMVYTLTGSFIFVHDKSLAEVRNFDFEDEYWDFQMTDGGALLLGYDTIELESVK
ncbi:MAG: DUF5711 family protein [Oscillospiraceae bacterium]|nr:DUF5711 family protein [Oscillospiraceae bacterium]